MLLDKPKHKNWQNYRPKYPKNLENALCNWYKLQKGQPGFKTIIKFQPDANLQTATNYYILHLARYIASQARNECQHIMRLYPKHW